MASLKDELNAFGRQAAGLAFPSTKNVTITIVSTGDYWMKPFIAPFNGWVKVASLINTSQVFEVESDSKAHHTFVSSNALKGTVMIPVRKGSSVLIGSGLSANQLECIVIASSSTS